jgi:LacI family transcriptional regulator
MKNPTIREVATIAGVSIGTVSRVLNGQPVSKKTSTAVQQAIDDLGYTPNSVAQSMRTNSTRAIGLVVNDISNPLFSRIAKAFDKVINQSGYSLFIANTENDPKRERLIIESMIQRRVDGLAIAQSRENDKLINAVLNTVNFPVILLDRDSDLPLSSVCDDHARGIEKGVNYLVDLGHTDIAIITGDNNLRPGRERARGYVEALERLGVRIRPELIRQGRFDAVYGVEQTAHLMSLPNKPTAIIAGGNQILAGVLRVVRQLGLRIPESFSLIACDEVDLSQLMDPPITVIARDIEQTGAVAAELMLAELAGGVSIRPQRRVIAPELIVRGSCARIS